MTPEQTVEYLSSVLLREGPRTAQSMRERAGTYIINLAPSGDCRAIRSAKANARNIIIVQWQVVAEEIEKDLAQDPVAP